MTPQPADYGRGIFGALRRFWLQPNDPTVLGLIRLMAGTVVVYVHLCYCFDLHGFFGPKAWWDHEAANRERKDAPMYAAPLTWPDQRPAVLVPDTHVRRMALVEMLRELPDDPAERLRRLRFYFQSLPPRDVVQQRAALQFVGAMVPELAHLLKDSPKGQPLTPQASADRLAYVREALQAAVPKTLSGARLPDRPEFMMAMDPAERAKLAEAVVDFLEVVGPKGESPNTNLEYFHDYPPTERVLLRQYVERLPADRDERLGRIDYLRVWGMDESQVYTKGRTLFSVWFHLTEPWHMWAVHAVTLVIMVLFTVGYQTRITSVLTWMLALGYLHRTVHIVFGMDAMMSILLLYLMIGPSGAAVSVDRLLERRRAARAIREANGQPVPWAERALAGPRHSVMANIAVRLLQVHFCFIYMSSGLSKLKGTMWWNGSAGWFTVASPEFSPIQFHFYEDTLRWLAGQRFLESITVGLMNYGTLFLEIGLPFLIWGKLRPVIFMLAVLLHTGIAILMGLNGFGLFMLCLLMSYLPASVIRSWLAGDPNRQPKVRLSYRPDDAAHQDRVEILRTLDTQGQIEFAGDARDGELKATAGKVAKVGDEAFTLAGRSLHLSKRLPGVFLLSRVLLLRGGKPRSRRPNPPEPVAAR